MIREHAPPPVIPDYELLKPIGRGSYGEVWLARSVTGVFRVVKIVRRDRFEDDRPFLRELEGISRFQLAVSGRPRQLALLHVGRNEEGGYFYYVMEPADDAEAGSAIDPDRYVPLTLKELFRRRGRLPAAECVQLALELARGLAVLHEAHLIHRDIKPSNIIFVQGVPKLADVGLVAASDASMTCVGTPGYVPPEGPGFVTADIYSLGKVIYEIATGLDRGEFPRLPSALADSSDAPLLREINAIVVRACHPDPRERQPSAAAMARDLELVQAGKSVAFYEGLRRRLRAFAIGAGVLGVLALVAAIIAGQVVWRADILRRANEQSRRALYRSDLAVAQLAKAGGDLGRARAALQLQIPKASETDLRGIEWSILNREVQGEGTPLETITNVSIRKIVTDPTGRWVAASFADDRVGIWELPSGRVSRVLENVKVLGGFLPDGRLVVDEPVRALRFEYPTNAPATRMETGQRLGHLLPGGIVMVVSPPTEEFVFRLKHLPQLTPLREFNAAAQWPEYGVSTFEPTPNGQSLIVSLLRSEGARRNRLLASIDLSSGREKWAIPLSKRILWIRCSPDNLHFVINIGAQSPTVGRIDDSSFTIRLEGHTARVQDAAFSEDGELIATAGADQTIRVWKVTTGELISTHRGLGRPASAVTWTPDKRAIIAGDDNGSVRIFPFPRKVTTNVLEGLFSDVHGDMQFSPTGDLLAVTATSNSIALVSTKDLQIKRSLTNLFQPITFTVNGKGLIAFRSDWSVWRMDLASDEISPVGSILPEGFWVNSWAVSPNRDNLAVAGNHGELVVLNLKTGGKGHAAEPSTNTIWALTFSSDSEEFWTGSADGVVMRWRTKNAQILGEVTRLEGDLQTIALSNDQRWLVVALFNDSSVRVFDRHRSKWLPPLLTHRRFVQSLSFTPDGSRLVSGGADGKVVLWRVPEFEEIAAFELTVPNRPTGDEGVFVMKLAPDNSAIAALSEDGRLELWRVQ